MDSIADGTAVVVVHGLDPEGQPAAAGEPSELNPDLPLAATAPALCGALELQPAGNPETGVITETGVATGGLDIGLLTLGGLLVAGVAAGAFIVARRTADGSTR